MTIEICNKIKPVSVKEIVNNFNFWEAPILITEDRYTGAYSNGKYWAIDIDLASYILEHTNASPTGDDSEMSEFWAYMRKYFPYSFGLGNSHKEAFDDYQSKEPQRKEYYSKGMDEFYQDILKPKYHK